MSALYISPTKFGKGLFSNRKFKKNEKICPVYGPLVRQSELPSEMYEEADRYVQIGLDLYIGPSYDFDDYINHSCDPNGGLVVNGNVAYLKAVRDINKGEEITFDYSTTLNEDRWEMDCDCDTPLCRKRVRDFKHLPDLIRQKYIDLGVVPIYNLIYAPEYCPIEYAYHEVRPLVPAR